MPIPAGHFIPYPPNTPNLCLVCGEPVLDGDYWLCNDCYKEEVRQPPNIYWVVTVRREHLGAGEQWVYLIQAGSEDTALTIAKKECGYTELLNKSTSQPLGIWSFYADRLPSAETTELSHSAWGGW